MSGSPQRQTIRLHVAGAVQGVGFRPFVYRLARELGLDGWVRNDEQGAAIEASGQADVLDTFRQRLQGEAPPAARIRGIVVQKLGTDPARRGFAILASEPSGAKSAHILPDLAMCPDCRRELFEETNRRFMYPFINCTHCGPRFSIQEEIPYDRAHTTMRGFTMCAACQAEYDDPEDRRFHAQPNACPACGPKLAWWDADGQTITEGHAALKAALEALRQGRIVAVKGIGGFHLMLDARNEESVLLLRQRKFREAKPLAVMVETTAEARSMVEIAPAEQALLESPAAPIVLLRKTPQAEQFMAPSVSPRNPYLGIMLAYSPLHALLARGADGPLVATSGNLSDEPICTDEHEAVQRLRGVADMFLVHNRPIARHLDDSVVRVAAGRPQMLRRARGFVPQPVSLRGLCVPEPLLAVGPHMKNTVALGLGTQVFISQHIGDLDNPQAAASFAQAAHELDTIYEAPPARVVCDLHPCYASTEHAEKSGLPVHRVQHHHAHIAACMAEHGLTGQVLGVSWDGTGYGTDGAIWGGEFLRATLEDFARIAHLRPFRLPGGELAVKEPRRAALGLLFEWLGPAAAARHDIPVIAAFSSTELQNLMRMLERGLNAPRTTSAGRLFDAVAALAGLRKVSSFEGQAAMDLEFAVDPRLPVHGYAFPLRGEVIDWEPMLADLLDDIARDTEPSAIATRFHHGLAQLILEVARRERIPDVILSGGCFQNKYLLEQSVVRLREAGFAVYWPQEIPTNDGGLSLGQVAVCAAQSRRANGSASPPPQSSAG